MSDVAKYRLLLSFVGLFILSFYMSCQELEYMMKGKVTNASLIDNHIEKESDHGHNYEKRVIGYAFADNNTLRREFADVPLDWDNHNSGTLRIQYIPGWDHHARLLGQNNLPWVIIFFGTIIACIAMLIVIARQT